MFFSKMLISIVYYVKNMKHKNEIPAKKIMDFNSIAFFAEPGSQ